MGVQAALHQLSHTSGASFIDTAMALPHGSSLIVITATGIAYRDNDVLVVPLSTLKN